MILNESTVERRHGRSYYFGSKARVEIEMSANLFAEAITSMNNGTGVPVTIRHILNQKMSDSQFYQKQAQAEVKSMVTKAKATIEAHLAQKFQDLGLKALAQQQVAKLGGKPPMTRLKAWSSLSVQPNTHPYVKR